MAIAVFVASTGLTLNGHYCKGELKSLKLMAKADNCHVLSVASCHKSVAEEEKPGCKHLLPIKDCCENFSEITKADSDLVNPTFVDLDVDKPASQFAFASTLQKRSFGQISNDNPYLNYKPPLILRDITVSCQVFLC